MKAAIYLTRDEGKSFLNSKPYKANIVFTPTTNKLSVKCGKLFKKNVKLAIPDYATKTQSGYILYFNPDTMEQTTFNLKQDRELFEKEVEANELLKSNKFNLEQFSGTKPQDHLTLGFAALLIVGLVLAIMLVMVTTQVLSPTTLSTWKAVAASMQTSATALREAAVLMHPGINATIANALGT